MGIKPALGWLGLLLFTTTAQAEGARDLLKVSPRTKGPPLVSPVTPKTKAPPSLRAVVAQQQENTPLGVVDVSGRPKADIEAAPVFMMFEREQRASFRVPRERIRRVIRLAREPKLEHVDVIEAEDGIVAIDTNQRGGAIANHVYVFGPRMTLDQRIGALESVPAPMRDRIREALVTAVWTPTKN